MLMNDALLKALKRLRLSGLAQTLDVRLQETAGHNLNHAEFLELILQDELAIREDRLLARRVRAADFREPKTLEDFDWQFNTSIKRKQVYDLATCKSGPNAIALVAQSSNCESSADMRFVSLILMF